MTRRACRRVYDVSRFTYARGAIYSSASTETGRISFVRAEAALRRQHANSHADAHFANWREAAATMLLHNIPKHAFLFDTHEATRDAASPTAALRHHRYFTRRQTSSIPSPPERNVVNTPQISKMAASPVYRA